MTKDTLLKGFLNTDASTSTLQYGRNINKTSWEYLEWVDQPHKKPKSLAFKLNNLDHSEWRQDIIDLKDYTKEQIADAISTYGYKIFTYDEEFITFQIEQSSELYGVKDSIQLACECIFELEL